MASLATWVGAYGTYRQSKRVPKAPAAVPMPDEEELRRAKRRTMAQHSTGRASTILTETGGFGG